MARSLLIPNLPRFIPPMLAKSGAAFDSPEHLFEIKWNGTRVLTFVDQNGYRLVNRNRAKVTDRYPELGFLATLPAGTILDGEIVVLQDGKSHFGLLLSRNQTRAPFKIQCLARMLPATYVVFDLPYDRFESLLALPLSVRRERLEKLMQRYPHPRWVFSQGVVGPGKAFFAEVRRLGLEGMMAKCLTCCYRPGRRTDAWIKIKPREAKKPLS